MPSATNNPLQLVFLPYAPLSHEVRIGDILFCPIKPGERNILYKYVKGTLIRKHINKVLRQYVTKDRERIPNVALATVGKMDFRELTPDEQEKLRAAKHILAFLCIDTNSQISWCTSDNFEILFQMFTPGDMGIAVKAGAIHSITSGGWKIGQLVFPKADWINMPLFLNYDKELLSAFEKCLHETTDPECQRMLRSLEWFFDAYKNSHDISQFSRILLMAMTFEMLLNFKNRQDFRNKIHDLLGDPSEPKSPTTIQTGPGQTASEDLTVKQVWANSFYELRNDIIHGNDVPSGRLNHNNKAHFLIAERFYRECVKKILTKKEFYGMRIGGEFFSPPFSTTPRELDDYLTN